MVKHLDFCLSNSNLKTKSEFGKQTKKQKNLDLLFAVIRK